MSVQVLCTRPNAGSNINGIDFHAVDGGMLSVAISQEQAEEFLAIPGYQIVNAPEKMDEARRSRKADPVKE